VKIVEKHFTEKKPTWESESLHNRGANGVDFSRAQYTGGAKIVSIFL
jgi:hypothetical protein